MILSVTRCFLIAAAAAISALGQSASPGAIIGAGYLFPTPINVAPGQVITLFAAGIGSSLTGPVYAPAGKLPTSLVGIGVTITQGTNMPAPILEVRPVTTCTGCGALTAITIQIPYGLFTPCNPSLGVCSNSEVVVLTEFFVTENGVAGTPSGLNVLADQVHILTICDTVLPGAFGYGPTGGLPCQPQVTHANGTLVSNANPAMVGEELVAYAVGLGATKPAVPTGEPATKPVPTAETFQLDFNFHPDALASKPFPSNVVPANYQPQIPLFTGLTPGYAGLYQINFLVPGVPAGLAPCVSGQGPGLVATNLTVSVGGSTSFDGAAICVSLPEPE
jgi:uncharacterized protein (TIGR03437 family)